VAGISWSPGARLGISTKPAVPVSFQIAVSRQHLTKLLHELERDGILWRDKGWFIIPEPERLWHWTDY
jgi:DNA-binding HxlR family transcriptional regulator